MIDTVNDLRKYYMTEVIKRGSTPGFCADSIFTFFLTRYEKNKDLLVNVLAVYLDDTSPNLKLNGWPLAILRAQVLHYESVVSIKTEFGMM